MLGVGVLECISWLVIGALVGKEVGGLLLRLVARRLDDKGWEVFVQHLDDQGSPRAHSPVTVLQAIFKIKVNCQVIFDKQRGENANQTSKEISS